MIGCDNEWFIRTASRDGFACDKKSQAKKSEKYNFNILSEDLLL